MSCGFGSELVTGRSRIGSEVRHFTNVIAEIRWGYGFRRIRDFLWSSTGWYSVISGKDAKCAVDHLELAECSRNLAKQLLTYRCPHAVDCSVSRAAEGFT